MGWLLGEWTVNNTGNALKHFLGVDIGSDRAKLVLAKVESWNSGTLGILEARDFSTEGTVDRSSIVNVDKLSKLLLDNLAPMLKHAVSSQIFTAVSVKNRSVQSKINRERNPFSRRTREVNTEDLVTACAMASNAPIENGREYINAILRQYRVDSRAPQKNPIGDIGSSVEAELLLVSTSIEEIDKYKRCFQNAKIPLDSFCCSALSAGSLVLTNDEREDGVLLLDIGAQGVAVAQYEYGTPKKVTVIPYGMKDIRRDISIELSVSEELAGNIMQEFSCVDPTYLTEFAEEEVLRGDDGKARKIYPEHIYQISLARMLEILQLVYRSLNITENTSAYPVVITGGGARLRGIISMVEKMTNARVRLAQPGNWGGPLDVYRSPNYSVAVGLCVTGMRQYYNNKDSRRSASGPSLRGSRSQGRRWKWLSAISSKLKNFFTLGDID